MPNKTKLRNNSTQVILEVALNRGIKVEIISRRFHLLKLTYNGKSLFLLEEFIDGKDYRLLVVGDKVSAVMERIPAHVIGDGKSNIRQLIKKFNQNPLVGEKYEKPLCKIRLNKEVAVEAAKAIGMLITGVDIIYDGLSKQPYVLELNDCPGIDIHHCPVMGQPRQVASDILEFLLKEELNRAS